MHSLSDLKFIDFPLFNIEKSFLVVYESEKTVSFFINRIFMVKAIEKSARDFHAHKKCSQLLVVLSGECRITCDDGIEVKEIILNKASQGLLIPPTLWAKQEYQSNTILMVLADKPYDEEDYIRDYSEFLKFRKER